MMIKYNELIKVEGSKLVIQNKNKEFLIGDVNFIEVISYRDKTINYSLNFTAILAFFSHLLVPIVFKEVSLNFIIGTSLLLCSVSLKRKKYRIQVITCHAEREFISIQKKELKEVNKFIKSFFKYKIRLTNN
ncbi:hypothetical protein [Flavobacterium sp.]